MKACGGRGLTSGIAIAGSAALAVLTVAAIKEIVRIEEPAAVRYDGSIAPDPIGDRVIDTSSAPPALPESESITALETEVHVAEEGLRTAAAETRRLHIEYQELSRNRRFRSLSELMDALERQLREADARIGPTQLVDFMARFDEIDAELVLFEAENLASPRRVLALRLLMCGYGSMALANDRIDRSARVLSLALDESESIDVRTAALDCLHPAGLRPDGALRLLPLLDANQDLELRGTALRALSSMDRVSLRESAGSARRIRDHLSEASRVESDPGFAERLRLAAVELTGRFEGAEAAAILREELSR